MHGCGGSNHTLEVDGRLKQRPSGQCAGLTRCQSSSLRLLCSQYITFDLPTESLELVTLPVNMVMNVFRRNQRLIVGFLRRVKQFDKGAEVKGWS